MPFEDGKSTWKSLSLKRILETKEIRTTIANVARAHLTKVRARRMTDTVAVEVVTTTITEVVTIAILMHGGDRRHLVVAIDPDEAPITTMGGKDRDRHMDETDTAARVIRETTMTYYPFRGGILRRSLMYR